MSSGLEVHVCLSYSHDKHEPYGSCTAVCVCSLQVQLDS